MPETIDFDQIARQIVNRPISPLLEEKDALFYDIREQLRLIWNARGAADITALELIIEKLGDTMDPDNARVFVGDALRTVDR